MKLTLLLVILCTVFSVSAIQNGDKNIKFEEEGSGSEGTDSINTLIKKMTEAKKITDDTDESEGSGNDDEDSSASGDQESGDGGSGGTTYNFVQTTKSKPGTKDKVTPSIVDITVVSSTTSAAPVTKKTTTMGNSVEDVVSTESIKPDANPAKSVTEKNDDEKNGINFTLGIIIGVVVGAILAILIIVFLVYRLRKKDEGSYSLDEQSSTAYLRADADNPTKGKEYFA